MTSCDSRSIHVLMAGLEALDLLGIGWMTCNAAGQVMAASCIAEKVLSSHRGLEVDADGAICHIARHRGRLLHQAVQRAAMDSTSGESCNRAAVLVRCECGNRPLTLLVSPLSKTLRPSCAHSAALVLILDPSIRSRATHSDLYDLYQLTATETALANLLMEGRSLVNCSRELGISRFTVRTHLDSIFRKTGVSHQSQLVWLLLRSIGLVRLTQQ